MITREELEKKIAVQCRKATDMIIKKQEYEKKCNDEIDEIHKWRDFYQEALDGMPEVYDED